MKRTFIICINWNS
jgi:hypothetical protein